MNKLTIAKLFIMGVVAAGGLAILIATYTTPDPEDTDGGRNGWSAPASSTRPAPGGAVTPGGPARPGR